MEQLSRGMVAALAAADVEVARVAYDAIGKLLAASGSHQAPWVRTLDDLLVGELPTCLPWGPEAKRYARTFRRTR